MNIINFREKDYKNKIRLFPFFVLTFALFFILIISAEELKTSKSFQEISAPLENPYMGWTKFSYQKESIVGNNLIKAYVTWNDLEPVKGQIDFEEFENNNNFSYWLARGYKYVLTFSIDSPDKNGEMDIPGWLYNSIKGDGTYYITSSGSKGFSPNYSNPVLIKEHSRIIAEFAQRYNNSDIFAIQMGSLGHWAENHTYYISDTKAAGAYPKVDIETQYLEEYAKGFTNVYVSSRNTRALAIKYKMGLHNHGFGDQKQTYNWFLDFLNEGYTNYYTGDKHPAYQDFWKYAPSGAEFMIWPYTKYLSDSTVQDTINQAKLSHLTYLMAPDQKYITTSVKLNMDKLLREVGYRLVLDKNIYSSVVTDNSLLNISMNWRNTGVAPCYFNWPMEIGITDSRGTLVYSTEKNVDLKNWLPGNKLLNFNLAIPNTINNGSYNLTVAFINPDTGTPGIKLAFDAPSDKMRYTIGQIQINRTTTLALPTSITISGPEIIPVNLGQSEYLYSGSVLNQSGLIMSDEPISWSIPSPVTGVSVNIMGLVTVQPGMVDEFVLRATSVSKPTIYTEKTIKPQQSKNPSSVIIYGDEAIARLSTVNTMQYLFSVRDANGIEMTKEKVVWSILPSVNGVSVDINGMVTIQPTSIASSFTLKAASTYNSAIYSTKNIRITDNRIVSSVKVYGVNDITVYSTATSSRFYANVYNQYNSLMSSEEVIWSIVSPYSGVSVSSDGVVSVLPETKSGVFELMAKSKTNSLFYNKKIVTIVNNKAVSFIKVYGNNNVILYPTGTSFQFSATVYNQYQTAMPDEGVIWSFSIPSNGVSINENGLVTIQGISTASKFEIKVTSVSNNQVNTTYIVQITRR